MLTVVILTILFYLISDKKSLQLLYVLYKNIIIFIIFIIFLLLSFRKTLFFCHTHSDDQCSMYGFIAFLGM